MVLKFESFEDDTSGVPDATILFRRVTWDLIGGRERCAIGAEAQISGNAFSDYPELRARELGYPGPCMSVALEAKLREHGFGPERLILDHPGYGVVRIRVEDLRSLTRSNGEECHQGVMASPEETEPWHAVVFEPRGGQRQKPVKAAIAAVAQWVIPLRND